MIADIKTIELVVAEPRNAQEAFEQHPHFKEHPSDIKPFRAFVRKFGYDLTKRDAFELVGFLQAFRVQQIDFAVDKARVEKELLLAHEAQARQFVAAMQPQADELRTRLYFINHSFHIQPEEVADAEWLNHDPEKYPYFCELCKDYVRNLDDHLYYVHGIPRGEGADWRDWNATKESVRP